MKKLYLAALFSLYLTACTTNNPNNTTQIYGEIQGGIETTHTSR